MRSFGNLPSGVFWAGCLSLLSGCGSPPAPDGGLAATGSAGGASLTVAGPFTHENLSVYMITSANPDQRDFITLDEGLESGQVAVSEKENSEVGELLIENRSDLPLFLQEGDRLHGGKQDRTFLTSVVVSPKSGKVPVPAMCIEAGRWQPGETGVAFAFSAGASEALAPKEVRVAAKLENDQGKVWRSVEVVKEMGLRSFNALSTTTSLNEVLDSPQAKEAIERYRTVLGMALADHPGAVGVAIAVNGKVEEIDVYPGPALLRKLYPRLLESYAFQAATRKPDAPTGELPAPAEVARLLREGQERSKEDRKIDADNDLSVRDLGDSVRCTTSFKGAVVHQQWLSK